ncbi:MAG: hypothetical protein CME19_14020 [Gemmatimonadetes bacterium]|nr:hypothetical protein [Gemmatimonadota bacterium]
MKRCLITGAAAGIGRALVDVFSGKGYEIVGVDVDPRGVEQTKRALSDRGVVSTFVVADLASSDGVSRCVECLVEMPPVDVVIHNAGISAVGRLPAVPLEDQLRVIDLNLTAPMALTASLLRDERVASGGSIVFVSSLSHYVGYPGASAYASTKDGIASYARSLRAELHSADIHVLTVFPGPTRTDHARRYSPDNSRESSRMDPERLAEMICDSVLRRRATLLPGLASRLAAFAGSWFPRTMERAMVSTILNRLDAPR